MDRQRGQRQSGQASVELVAVLPLLAALALGLLQLLATALALTGAGEAARAGARAAHTGADPRAAAAAALPGFLGRPDVEVAGGEVRVGVRAPSPFPGLDGIAVRARAALEPDAAR